jgi:hypothetical protein
MAKRKRIGNLRVLPHERLVELEYNKVKIQGIVFGSDHVSNYLVCLPADELAKAGITGHGPCINKPIHMSKVTFIEGVEPVITRRIDEDEEIEEEDGP